MSGDVNEYMTIEECAKVLGVKRNRVLKVASQCPRVDRKTGKRGRPAKLVRPVDVAAKLEGA